MDIRIEKYFTRSQKRKTNTYTNFFFPPPVNLTMH